MRSARYNEWLKLLAASLVSSLVSVALVLLPPSAASRPQPASPSMTLVSYPYAPAPLPSPYDAQQHPASLPAKIVPPAEKTSASAENAKPGSNPGPVSDAGRAAQPAALRDEYFAHHYEITIDGTEHILALATAHPHPPRVHYYEISVRDR